MIAEGIIVSKLSYLITLWGDCGAGLSKALQVILNKAARVVTRLDWTTVDHINQGAAKSVWVAKCESADFLPLSFTTAQGEAQWNPHVFQNDCKKV